MNHDLTDILASNILLITVFNAFRFLGKFTCMFVDLVSIPGCYSYVSPVFFRTVLYIFYLLVGMTHTIVISNGITITMIYTILCLFRSLAGEVRIWGYPKIV